MSELQLGFSNQSEIHLVYENPPTELSGPERAQRDRVADEFAQIIRQQHQEGDN